MNFPETVLEFLKELSANNNRDWFNENKPRYLIAKNEFEEYIRNLLAAMSEFDPAMAKLDAKECIFRIYRDTRFAKDKSPYKNNMGAYFVQGGKKSGMAGYYLHIQPGESFVAGGIYMPPSPALKAIRDEIYYDVDRFKSIIFNKQFVEAYGEIMGEKLKTSPKGFDKEWPDIDLLRFKSYTVAYPVSDQEILSLGFFEKVIELFKIQYPFIQYLNKALK